MKRNCSNKVKNMVASQRKSGVIMTKIIDRTVR